VGIGIAKANGATLGGLARLSQHSPARLVRRCCFHVLTNNGESIGSGCRLIAGIVVKILSKA